MSYAHKRAIPYNAGALHVENADDVVSFNLPAGADGFRLRSRSSATAVLKFAIDTQETSRIIDDYEAHKPWTSAEFGENDGRYETIPADTAGGWRNIRLNKTHKIYVTSDTAATYVELTLFY